MKVLYFYPENPTLINQGNNSRAFSLLKYFKSRKIDVHLVSEEQPNYTDEDLQKIVDSNLIQKGYQIKRFRRKGNQLQYFFLFSLPNFLFNRIKQFNRVRFGYQEYFDEILKTNEYDYIVISYVCWTELIRNNPHLKKAKLIIDTHDLLTSQFQNTNNFRLGDFFQKEIELLNNYDTIIAISVEEAYVYSQFTKKKVKIISHSVPDNFSNEKITKSIDIIYVASDNDHNKISAKWFFDEVYPLLNKSLKIVVVGRVVDYFPDFPNVEKVKYVEDLNEYYNDSKIAICPMLSGTGLKIKVIEAMSYGLPIVCNERGVDGLFNKTNNGCLVSNELCQFADNIHKLLENDLFYKTNANLSKQYFIENNSINTVYQKLDKIFI